MLDQNRHWQTHQEEAIKRSGSIDDKKRGNRDGGKDKGGPKERERDRQKRQITSAIIKPVCQKPRSDRLFLLETVRV